MIVKSWKSFPNNKLTPFNIDINKKLISLQCINLKLAVANCTYLEGSEKHCPKPSIRVLANRLLTDKDMDFAIETIDSVSTKLSYTVDI